MKYLYKNKYWPVNKDYNLDKLLYLMIDRPNDINQYNDFTWLRDYRNQPHRDYDLPSNVYTFNDGTYSLYWRKNGKHYRLKDKPTIIYYNGAKKYYINNTFIKRKKLK